MTHKLIRMGGVAGLAMTGFLLSACGESDNRADISSASDEDTATATAVGDGSSGDGGYTDMVAAAEVSEEGYALGGVSIGNPDAPVTVIEYASMTCPHCARFTEEVVPKLMEQYVATGQVRYEFRNFVMNQYDMAASALARCRGPEQFFPVTDLFFSTQRQWLANAREPQKIADDMAAVARRAGISRTEFDRCINDRTLSRHLAEMTQQANAEWQIPGTPTVIVNGELQGNDALAFEGLSEAIEAEL